MDENSEDLFIHLTIEDVVEELRKTSGGEESWREATMRALIRKQQEFWRRTFGAVSDNGHVPELIVDEEE